MSVNAVVAVLLGVVTASLLLIPTAAVQYRRDGRLGLNDLTALFAGAVYGAAIWSYTLLPLPAPGRIRCQGSQLRVFGSWESIRLPPGASASAA